ncbi:MAG: sigma-54 dependent transcriptional regulator [Candidatus Poribacteria bacterium]|nr:sigma-54 dependent transcriptional regulator [Candidatus Poribacteria bacterium]MDE0502768.1 sigma-54 dependent transcriptional regulator [Candidatus Poribacteria bacterium]
MSSKFKPSILIIDDEISICESLEGVLEDEGYTVQTALSGEDGVRLLASEHIDLVFLDILMPGGMDGIETLKRLKQMSPDTEILMISGHGTFDLALEAGQLGASDFLGKPLSLYSILRKVEAIGAKIAIRNSDSDAGTDPHVHGIVGDSPQIHEILLTIRQVAPTNGRVLVTGESGTGKELIAHAIHAFSERVDAPLVKVNCAAIPQELIESELFGHEAGSFTGASKKRVGKFEQADGGTIFLDEIGDMSLSTQAKVLRVLEEREYERVGGNQTLRTDVRVISATNKHLPDEIESSNFREDLYYRLNVVPIHVPPLRERVEDLPLLADYFLSRFCRENGKQSMFLSDAAMNNLRRRDWLGNVRELRNLMERAVILCPNLTIDEIDLSEEIRRENADGDNSETSLKDARQEFESRFILNCLKGNSWNITETAKQLGIERTHLHRKMRQYEIEREP